MMVPALQSRKRENDVIRFIELFVLQSILLKIMNCTNNLVSNFHLQFRDLQPAASEYNQLTLTQTTKQELYWTTNFSIGGFKCLDALPRTSSYIMKNSCSFVSFFFFFLQDYCRCIRDCYDWNGMEWTGMQYTALNLVMHQYLYFHTEYFGTHKYWCIYS